MEKKRTRLSNFIYLVRIYLRYAKGWFVIVALSCLVAPIQAYIDIVLLRDTVNAVTANQNIGYIALRISILAVIFLLTILINQIIETYMGENVNVKISNRINKDIYIKVLQTDFKYFDDPEFYDNYTWTLNGFYQQTFSAIQIIWRFIMVVLTLGTLITLIASMDFVIILVVLLSVIITTWINIINNKEIYKKAEESLPYQRRLGYVQRVFYLKDFSMGLKSTKIKDVFLKQYDDNTKELSNVIKRHRFKITFMSILGYSVFLVTRMGCLVYLCYSTLAGRINIGEMTSLFLAVTTLKSNIESFFNLIAQTQNLNLYTEKIRSFFDMKSNIEVFDEKKALAVGNQAYEIQFKDVCFKYNDQSRNVLEKLNFTIKPKQKIAIVGENGAGKSTITKLLLRLYDVSSGQIYINGHEISSLNLNDLRNNIGIAFQESIMYAMSVKDNIKVYDHDLNDDAVKNLMNKINISKILDKNNASLETQVTKEFDSGGIEFSGGERQIMAIARVLIKSFGLLILDEPSSSLDPMVEYDLNKTIMEETGDSTVIIISHRLSSVRDADCIFMLSEGRITEQGTHKELMDKKGKYYEMFTKQSENYIKE